MLSYAHEGDIPSMVNLHEVLVATAGAGEWSPWLWCCFGGLGECRRGSLWGGLDAR